MLNKMNGNLAVCMFVRVQTDLENQENLENSGKFVWVQLF